MAVFGDHSSAEVLDAAERYIGKMDERELASAIEQGEPGLSSAAREHLLEAVFDAFRQRGESSQDAAEGAGTTLEAIQRSDRTAIRALLTYAGSNPGLLKDAATGLVEREPSAFAALSPQIADGIRKRLQNE